MNKETVKGFKKLENLKRCLILEKHVSINNIYMELNMNNGRINLKLADISNILEEAYIYFPNRR